MAVYRKKLVDKDGNTIIPAVGDIYGTVYNATLSTATAGDTARYDFTPDTPVENNKVYAVKFPDPTVNNATIILGDGVVSGSILVPPVSATDAPNYELLTTDMINNTEPLLLMYSGVQWVCLNQKKKVATADLENGAVSSNKINWATLKATRADASWLSVSGGTFKPTTTWFIIASYACAFGLSVYVSDGDTRIFSGRQQTASGYSWGAFSALLFKGHTYTFTRDNDGNAQWQGASVYTIS